MVGLVQPLVVDQVDGLGADQPEVPLDFGDELARDEFVEWLLERLEAQQLELDFWLDLDAVANADLERNIKLEGSESPVDKVQSSSTGILEACLVCQ